MLEKTRTLIERKARSLFTKSAANNPIAEQQMQQSLVNQYKLALAQGHTLYFQGAARKENCLLSL